MNPLIPAVIIGGGMAAVAFNAEASAPMTTDDPGETTFPIGNSDDSSTPPIDYGPDMSGNISAFLAVIREGESSDNYRALVGGGNFSDFSHHPATPPITFSGIRNSDGTFSHAAGAYQFQPATWTSVAKSLNLPDFSPASQDAGAIQLLRQRGAYDYIAMGDISSAVGKLTAEWQMFTTNRWSVANVESSFQSNGGNVA